MTNSYHKQRWVIKIGTGILTNPLGQLDLPSVACLAAQVAELKKRHLEIVLVSSGAVGSGMGVLGLTQRPSLMAEVQACAALGQPKLMHIYEEVLSQHSLHAAQLLLTYFDLDSRTLYKNAQQTLEHLLRHKNIIPIINENDVVSYEEIKFGDNDRLSAHIAQMIHADRLILLSTIHGLMENADGSGALIPVVSKIDESIRKRAGQTSSPTAVGGMISKIEAAELATQAGIPTQIAHGKTQDILLQIYQNQPVGTLFES